MKRNGREFLSELAALPTGAFERRFATISTRLGLGGGLDRSELKLLYEATFLATLCNIAFNGLGGCRGEIRPEIETNRLKLEREFMAARNLVFGSSGWQALPKAKRGRVERTFLSVLVKEENLAL